MNGKRNARSLRPRRQQGERIDDRRGVEKQLRAELPDLPHVSERDEEGRQDERHAEHEDVELEQERHEQQPVELRDDALPGDEAGDDDER